MRKTIRLTLDVTCPEKVQQALAETLSSQEASDDLGTKIMGLLMKKHGGLRGVSVKDLHVRDLGEAEDYESEGEDWGDRDAQE